MIQQRISSKSIGQIQLPASDSLVVSIPMRSLPDTQQEKLPVEGSPPDSFSAELGLTVPQVEDSTMKMINHFPLEENSFLSDSMFPSFQAYPNIAQSIEAASQLESSHSPIPDDASRLSGDLGVFSSFFGNDILDISQLSLSQSVVTSGNDGWCVSWDEKEPLPLQASPLSAMGDETGPVNSMNPISPMNVMSPANSLSPVNPLNSMTPMSPLSPIGSLGLIEAPIFPGSSLMNPEEPFLVSLNTLQTREHLAKRQQLLEETGKEEVEFIQGGQVIDITQENPVIINPDATGLETVVSDPEDCVSFYQGGKKLEECHFQPETISSTRLSIKRSEESPWQGGIKFSLEETELKKLCSKFYSVNPPDCVLEDSDHFKGYEVSQPPFVLPNELEYIRNSQEPEDAMMLSSAGKIGRSE